MLDPNDVNYKGKLEQNPMQDIQNQRAEHLLAIDRVGVKDLRIPLMVRDREQGHQHTVAKVDVSVDLPAAFKGTHMSRFVEALEHWRKITAEPLDYPSLRALLEDIRQRLRAQSAHISFHFPYFRTKHSPVSGQAAPVDYACTLSGELKDSLSVLLELQIPVTTVCPCSKAISRAGAHGQRSIVHLAVRMSRFNWLEEFIDLVESSASAPVYALLKRADEKFVTEQAYDNPCFVEDVVRNVAHKLLKMPHITWFRVEIESFESIHAHNAFACIEKDLR